MYKRWLMPGLNYAIKIISKCCGEGWKHKYEAYSQSRDKDCMKGCSVALTVMRTFGKALSD